MNLSVICDPAGRAPKERCSRYLTGHESQRNQKKELYSVIPLVSNVISAKISISMSCGFFINLGETSGEIPINSPR